MAIEILVVGTTTFPRRIVDHLNDTRSCPQIGIRMLASVVMRNTPRVVVVGREGLEVMILVGRLVVRSDRLSHEELAVVDM